MRRALSLLPWYAAFERWRRMRELERQTAAYRESLRNPRGGIVMHCSDCERRDGTHAPGCPWRLIGGGAR